VSYHLTRHAEVRLRQRGLRERDVEVVLAHGTPTPEAVVLTNKDVDRVVGECRRLIAQLERLRGTAVFTREEVVVTTFRPEPEQLRVLMRRARRGRRRGRR
jgi:hypothetical protein